MTRRSPNSMQALMCRYADGDSRAFERLARTLEPRVRRFIQGRMYDPDLVDDLVQETFLRVHVSRERYAAQRSMKSRSVEAWFMTTARRTMLDHMRAEEVAAISDPPTRHAIVDVLQLSPLGVG